MEYDLLRNLWADVRFDGHDFQEELLCVREEDGIAYREVLFSGHRCPDGPVRVYALYGAPKGQEGLPAILHVHGGGQTVKPQWVEYWCRLGYAALSFNWGGEWPDRHPVTRYPESAAHANATRATGGYLEGMEHGPRGSAWFQWVSVTLAALAYLRAQPAVDRTRVGAMGVSVGGSLLWHLCALDSNLACACAIYGCGWNEYNGSFKHDPDAPPIPLSEKMSLWLGTMAPQLYAPLVSTPMLFLSATNDEHGNMDRSYDTLAAIPPGVPRRSCFTPLFRHHIIANQQHTLPMWMDHWLRQGEPFPQTPLLTLQQDDRGKLKAWVFPDRPADVREIEVFYAEENANPFSRSWRRAEGGMVNGQYRAELPLALSGGRVFAFANVYYRQGMCVSSGPAHCTGGAATAHPERVLYAGGECLDAWAPIGVDPDPLPPIAPSMEAAAMRDGRIGVRPLNSLLFTYRPGDPMWRAPKGASLAFWAESEKSFLLSVRAIANACTASAIVYETKIGLNAGELRRHVLRPEAFAAKDGTPLVDFSAIQCLEVEKLAGEVIFTDFTWI